MRFLLIHADYPSFREWLYSSNPGLGKTSWETQLKARYESLFFWADFYSRNLRRYGHEAMDVFCNNYHMQSAWAREHGVDFTPSRKLKFRMRKGIVPWIWRTPGWRWRDEILEAQIKEYKPDIIYSFNVWLEADFLHAVKKHARLLVGQHAASKLSESKDWSCFDLIFSSFPPTIEWFREKGVRAEMLRLGFDPVVLEKLDDVERDIPLSYAGSFVEVHGSRIRLMEKLCRETDLKVWSSDIEKLEPGSPLRAAHMGEAWGKDMFQVLRRSRVTFNHHGDVPPYANNLRLYEATGVGTLLVTDWKENLHEMFEPEKEVVTYRTPEECAEKVKYYLEHDDEREAIAEAGRKKTLDEHTYYQRVGELIDIVGKYL